MTYIVDECMKISYMWEFENRMAMERGCQDREDMAKTIHRTAKTFRQQPASGYIGLRRCHWTNRENNATTYGER